MMEDPVVSGLLGGLLDSLFVVVLACIIRVVAIWRARPSPPEWLERFAWPVALGCWAAVAAMQFVLIADRVSLAAAMLPPAVMAGLMARWFQRGRRRRRSPA
jgi:hypothetical protein